MAPGRIVRQSRKFEFRIYRLAPGKKVQRMSGSVEVEFEFSIIETLERRRLIHQRRVESALPECRGVKGTVSNKTAACSLVRTSPSSAIVTIIRRHRHQSHEAAVIRKTDHLNCHIFFIAGYHHPTINNSTIINSACCQVQQFDHTT